MNAAPLRWHVSPQPTYSEKDQYDQELQSLYDAITQSVKPGAELGASLKDGELSFQIDGVTLLDRIFLDKDEEVFVLAQWKVIAQSFSVTAKTDGKKLCNALRKLAVSASDVVKEQIIDLEAELAETEGKIENTEREMNNLLYHLYDLTDDEKQIVEQSV